MKNQDVSCNGFALRATIHLSIVQFIQTKPHTHKTKHFCDSLEIFISVSQTKCSQFLRRSRESTFTNGNDRRQFAMFQITHWNPIRIYWFTKSTIQIHLNHQIKIHSICKRRFPTEIEQIFPAKNQKPNWLKLTLSLVSTMCGSIFFLSFRCDAFLVVDARFLVSIIAHTVFVVDVENVSELWLPKMKNENHHNYFTICTNQ